VDVFLDSIAEKIDIKETSLNILYFNRARALYGGPASWPDKLEDN
jgi:hypothetical protein